MYENDIFSLCETSNAFIYAFPPLQTPFSHPRPFKPNQNNVFFSRFVRFSSSVHLYQKDSHTTGTTKRSMTAYDEIWSTETVPTALTHPAREHYKTHILCEFTI